MRPVREVSTNVSVNGPPKDVQHLDAIPGGHFNWNEPSDAMLVVDLVHRTPQDGLPLADASAHNRRPDQFFFFFA